MSQLTQADLDAALANFASLSSKLDKFKMSNSLNFQEIFQEGDMQIFTQFLLSQAGEILPRFLTCKNQQEREEIMRFYFVKFMLYYQAHLAKNRQKVENEEEKMPTKKVLEKKIEVPKKIILKNPFATDSKKKAESEDSGEKRIEVRWIHYPRRAKL